jgi:DNA-binding transcriptional regulator PaaX
MNVKDQTLAALEAVLWFYDQTAGPHYLTRGKASLSDFFESLVREAEREGWMDMHPSAARTYSGFSAKLKQVNGIRIDPVEGWEHAWDGKWRWLMFDLPASEKVMRVRIWRYLRTHGFGCLQRSIWITPFPTSFYDEIAHSLEGLTDKAIVITGDPEGLVRPFEPVDEAWDWDKLLEQYRVYENTLTRIEATPVPVELGQTCELIADERRAWQTASEGDPFLPTMLHPLVWCQRSTFVNLQSKWAGARRRGGECVRRHMTRSATKLQPILTATS